MLSGIAKLSLVATAVAPVFATMAVKEALHGDLSVALGFAIGTLLLVLVCYLIIRASRSRLERLSIEITSIKTADTEIVGFLVAYLLPLIVDSQQKYDVLVLSFVVLLFTIVVWTTNSLHFNPVLGLLGYHFYEVTLKENVTFILLTKKCIRNTRQIRQAVQIGEYMLVEPKE